MRSSTASRPSASAAAIWRAKLDAAKESDWPGPMWLKARITAIPKPSREKRSQARSISALLFA